MLRVANKVRCPPKYESRQLSSFSARHPWGRRRSHLTRDQSCSKVLAGSAAVVGPLEATAFQCGRIDVHTSQVDHD